MVQEELSEHEKNLIENFEATYNLIERELRRILGKDKYTSFSRLVDEYARQRKKAFEADADYLKMIGELRNLIIHEKIKPYQYVAIPTPGIIARLEKILERLKNPPLVIPTFGVEVETVSTDDSIADVLKRVSDKNYSQFPIYDGNDFKGLLTENGITRWLARYVSDDFPLVQLDEVSVEEVLGEEEQRQNCMSIARNKLVDEAIELFADNELLEAILITESGKDTEKLLGIATRWDMLKIKE
jgi:predicted transcriptional regulator